MFMTSVIFTQDSERPDEVDLDIEIELTEEWRIAYIIKDFRFAENMDDPTEYWTVAAAAATNYAQELGAEVDILFIETSEEDCTLRQIRLMVDAIDADYDGIILAAFDSERLIPVTEVAVEAGVPVVTMDTAVNTDAVLAHVAFDSY